MNAVRLWPIAIVEFLEREIDWLQRLINERFNQYFASENPQKARAGFPPPPELREGRSNLEDLILNCDLHVDGRIALALAMVPHVRPSALDLFYTRNSTFDRRFSEFGGETHSEHSGFLPTAETFLFLAAGDDLECRLQASRVFNPDHVLARQSILYLATPSSSEQRDRQGYSRRLLLDQSFFAKYILEQSSGPELSIEFPASMISTGLEWDDIVLADSTLDQLLDLKDWLEFGSSLRTEYQMASRIRPGFTSLFYGPPGTGKTLTATLLGKDTGRDVYRIDLSMVVSKWIGETEKNLAKVFGQAEGKNWILFFDEADALFGKRTETYSANDRFANQEVSFLLQRIEEFDGLAILASNLKENIDRAFTRRFQSVINFPMPAAPERLQLWQNSFPPRMELEETIDLGEVAERHEISGGVIVNVAQYCAVKAIKRGNCLITFDDLAKGLEKELIKEGFFPV